MAAEKFVWTGNAGGTINGCVIAWGDYPFSLTGNSSLIINRQGTNELPAGFTRSPSIAPLPRTYEEF